MQRYWLAAIGLLALLATPAQARSISGFLAQCTAVAVGSCTEQTATGYARQPVSFGNLVNGNAVQATPYSFAQAVQGNIAGRAIYDAVTGGNLLLVLPVASAYTIPTIGDRGDVGTLAFNVPAANGMPDGEALNTVIQAATTFGSMVDGSPVSSGVAIKFRHGFAWANFGSADFNTRTATQVTGFAYAVPSGVSAVNLKGAATLAAGTVTLPTGPIDGFLFRLHCSVTVTALTLAPGSGATYVGTAPTTCGPNAGHMLQYFAADSTWHSLF